MRKIVGKQPGEYQCAVLEQVSVAPGCLLLFLAAPQIARSAAPGQFVLIGCGTRYDPFLRRPLSIHQVKREQGEVGFLYRVRGIGTQWLAERRKGDVVSLLGPLGRGFTYPGRGKKGLLVGAGVGVAPLLFLAGELAALDWKLAILIGARTRTEIFRSGAFMEYGTVKTVAEDGSTERRGTVLELLYDELREGVWDGIYACGPRPVLKGVQRISKETGIPAQIALEERMACGVGACLGCVCQGAGEAPRYLRVCREGPVFDAWEVIL
ncbi:MAG: dihydroorotate dehydrogenase electron transfer subunit [Firmicutes bacterium]|nr:dihydroorotate dehydrogenase electron transfer subunit [Bacillota bacterium]